MKKTIYLCICAFLSFKAYAQQTPLGYYAWMQGVRMTPCDLDGNELKDAQKILSLPGQKFSAIARLVKDTSMIIRVVNYDRKSEQSKEKYKIFNKKDDIQLYFKVSQSDIQEVAQNRKRVPYAMSAGVINFPMKFRLQRGGDWESAFNFGAGAGVTFPHMTFRAFKHSIITGYSSSTVGLEVVSVSKNPDKLKDFKDFQAFSFSIGYLLQYEVVQAGLFFGFDHLRRSTQEMFSWKFQGRPWASIGIGLAIFSNEKNAEIKDNITKNK